MGAYKTHLDNLDTNVDVNIADMTAAWDWLFNRGVSLAGALSNYARRAALSGVSATQVNFFGTHISRRPVVLCKDGRKAIATALPTSLTISGGAGTKYVYADLGTPDGTGNSAITLVQSATAPDAEATSYRMPLGSVEWSGTAISSIMSYEPKDASANPPGEDYFQFLAIADPGVPSGDALKLYLPQTAIPAPNGLALEGVGLRYGLTALDGGSTARRFVAPSLTPQQQTQNYLLNGGMESWSGGTSAAPDFWTLTGAGATVAREGTIIKVGTYSAKVTRAGTTCFLTQRASTAKTYLEPFLGYFGLSGAKRITLGGWVYTTVANQARLYLSDGTASVNSSYASGASTWEWLILTHVVTGGAGDIVAGLRLDNADGAAYLDGAILVAGEWIPDYLPHPWDKTLRVSNFQTTAAANDEAVANYRAEIGKVSVTASTAASSISTVITFGTAFRTIRAAYLSGDTLIGLKRGMWVPESIGTGGFTARHWTADGAVYSSSAGTGTAFWLAIGHQ